METDSDQQEVDISNVDLFLYKRGKNHICLFLFLHDWVQLCSELLRSYLNMSTQNK